VGKPPILIMDEPTSSMDMNAEKALIDRLKSHLPDSTLVVITHKSSLLDLVDRVIVVDQGKVVADGPKSLVLGPATAKGTTP
jgi:ATP-binding cassette subfamily C protein LapB